MPFGTNIGGATCEEFCVAVSERDPHDPSYHIFKALNSYDFSLLAFQPARRGRLAAAVSSILLVLHDVGDA
jgi:hypothetical protein